MTAVVYRAYAFSGALLYVGSTRQLRTRLLQHANFNGAWWRLCREITVEEFPSDAAARQAEAEAIRVERPVFNLVGTGAPLNRLGDYPVVRPHRPVAVPA